MILVLYQDRLLEVRLKFHSNHNLVKFELGTKLNTVCESLDTQQVLLTFTAQTSHPSNILGDPGTDRGQKTGGWGAGEKGKEEQNMSVTTVL